MMPSEASEIPKAVYVILRVFDMKTNLNLTIYVDPATMMAEERLWFDTEGWYCGMACLRN